MPFGDLILYVRKKREKGEVWEARTTKDEIVQLLKVKGAHGSGTS